MVACSQPLAAEAGLSILKAGGNAVDAAIATAAALNVTEPCSTGMGGDCFLLYFDGEKVHALNGSGRSPTELTPERVRADCGEKIREMPQRHAHSVTVPGATAGWCDAIDRWGTLPLSTVLDPAIQLAEGGFPVSPVTAYHWREGEVFLKQNTVSRLTESVNMGFVLLPLLLTLSLVLLVPPFQRST